ncbi:MAG: EAL domain-containing protein, partial [Ruminiclostridium sp.]|nr:EAL domain-containing protein [Ruminiclostridium sp.]
MDQKGKEEQQLKKDKRRRSGESQMYFGLKCVLLAFSMLIISFSIIFRYLVDGWMHSYEIVVPAGALICITAVLLFEINTYRNLSNEGVREIYREKNIELDKLDKFKRLIKKNDFVYNFQPIVNAKNGEIFAYEVLMRTDDEIGLKPLEIIKYAEISNMLYSIEHSTFFNALRYYKE